MSLISRCEQKLFRLYFSCTKQRKAVIDTLSPVAAILLFKTALYVKANSKEISEEIIIVSLFFQTNGDVSIFVEI